MSITSETPFYGVPLGSASDFIAARAWLPHPLTSSYNYGVYFLLGQDFRSLRIGLNFPGVWPQMILGETLSLPNFGNLKSSPPN
jgi:hypothetical protein